MIESTRNGYAIDAWKHDKNNNLKIQTIIFNLSHKLNFTVTILFNFCLQNTLRKASLYVLTIG